jgi:hypothetical protein
MDRLRGPNLVRSFPLLLAETDRSQYLQEQVPRKSLGEIHSDFDRNFFHPNADRVTACHDPHILHLVSLEMTRLLLLVVQILEVMFRHVPLTNLVVQDFRSLCRTF